ncbi:23S rRNA (guanosine(2251)-2'-O)-methyltransferase RlmB [bacterium]
MQKDFVCGRNAVAEILDSQRSINKIIIAKGAKGKVIDIIIDKAKQKKIVFFFKERIVLDKIAGNNQGIVAFVSAKKYDDINSIIDSCDMAQNPVLCLLDRITDPRNLGAIARSAYTLGAQGLIIPKRNTCSINNTVVKTSAGAIEFLPVAQVNNIVNTMKLLKQKGFWLVGLDMNTKPCWEYNFKRPVVIIAGSEGKGLHKLVKENCDDLISIPQLNDFDSLNVSCACSIVFYEIIKQRQVI